MALPDNAARRLLERYVRWAAIAVALLMLAAVPLLYRTGDLFVLLLVPLWALPFAVGGFVVLALYLLVVYSGEPR